MELDYNILKWVIDNFQVFVLVLARIGSFLFLMPVFSSKALPVQIKAAAALVLALIFTPMTPFSADQLPSSPLNFILFAVAEIFLGMTMALFLRLIFAGLQTAGQMVGVQMGLSVANIMDPQTGVQSVIVTQFAYLIALLFFLSWDGHHVLLILLNRSFTLVEPGKIELPMPLYDMVMSMGRDMFILSVTIMAPVITILLFSQVALGILSKMVPQINMLIVSFGLNVGLGLLFMGITLQVFWPVFSSHLEQASGLMPEAMRLMGGK